MAAVLVGKLHPGVISSPLTEFKLLYVASLQILKTLNRSHIVGRACRLKQKSKYKFECNCSKAG